MTDVHLLIEGKETKNLNSIADVPQNRILQQYFSMESDGNHLQTNHGRFSGETKRLENATVGDTALLPRAQIMRDILINWSDRLLVEELHAIKVGTPTIHESSHKATNELAAAFGENLFKTEEGQFLRCASDFGVFSLLSKSDVLPEGLPLRLYEMALCHRKEGKRTVPLTRASSFHMPDMHTLLPAKEMYTEFRELAKFYNRKIKEFGIDYMVCLRTAKEEWAIGEEHIRDFSEFEKIPIHVHIVEKRRRYWDLKLKFVAIEQDLRPVQLATVQVDRTSASNFGMDQDLSICHSSPGGLERWIAVLLHRANTTPSYSLPLWISPCQLRVIPAGANLSTEFIESRVRYEIDFRNLETAEKVNQGKTPLVHKVAILYPDKTSISGKDLSPDEFRNYWKDLEEYNRNNPYASNHGLRKLYGKRGILE